MPGQPPHSAPSGLYAWTVRHRRAVGAAALVLTALALFSMRSMGRDQDASFMLPDSGRAAEDFALLARAPFLKWVLIDIQAPEGADPGHLARAAHALAARLVPPLFAGARAGPGPLDPTAVVRALLENAPNLLAAGDYPRLEASITDQGVASALARDKRELAGLRGLAVKSLIRLDPLDIRSLLVPSLARAASFGRAGLRQGAFVSHDGRHALVVARTEIPVTDPAGSERVLAEVDRAVQGLPQGFTATVVAGHRHALANAGAVKADLKLLLGLSVLLLGAVYVFFFRNLRGLYVLLVPGAALALAAGATALALGSVSGVVLGFGAVLMGIAVDYGLHVYFALNAGGPAPGPALSRVARLLAVAWLTTSGAFASLFLSGLPVLRQLAFFSLAGLASALVLSLVLLPPLVAGAAPRPLPRAAAAAPSAGKWPALAVWTGFVLGCLIFAFRVQVSGDPRDFGVLPPGLAEDEARVAATWGLPRSRAVIFARGRDFGEALARQAEAADLARQRLPGIQMTALDALVPRPGVQAENRKRWQEFWTPERIDALRGRILEQGRELGFAPGAFDPFFKLLAAEPAPMGEKSLDALGLAALREMLVAEADGETLVMAVAPDDPGLVELFDDRTGDHPHVRLVSQGRFAAMAGQTMRSDALLLLAPALGLAALAAALALRSPRRTLAALMPPVTGVLAVLGAAGALGLKLTIFSIVALPLVIGLGADYGVFLSAGTREARDLGSARAVIVSGLTTLGGFGVLCLASHPALRHLGLSVSLGVGAALICALTTVRRLTQ